MAWAMHPSHAASPDGLGCARCGVVSREFAATMACAYASPISSLAPSPVPARQNEQDRKDTAMILKLRADQHDCKTADCLHCAPLLHAAYLLTKLAPAPAEPTTDALRLQELAVEGAEQLYRTAISLNIGHRGPFDACSHHDCVLVRAAALQDAPRTADREAKP